MGASLHGHGQAHTVPMNAGNELGALTVALEHARQWQRLHAEQRMHAMDFFLIAAAFLTTAYVTVLSSSPLVAVAVAVIGVTISFAFNRMEIRSRQLVKRGEQALAPLERRLAELTENPLMELVKLSERSAFFTSYAKVFGLLHWVAFVGFALAVVAALISALFLR